MDNFEIIEEENNLNISNNIFPEESFIHEDNELFDVKGLTENYPLEKYLNKDKGYYKNEDNSIKSFDNFFLNNFNKNIELPKIDNFLYIENPILNIKLENAQEKDDIDGIFLNIPKPKTTDYKTGEIILEKLKIIGNESNISKSKMAKKKGINEMKNIPNSKIKYFNIKKVNKKVGRLEKKLKKLIKGKHDKFSQDNIIRKIKAYFQNNILNYINKKYDIYLESINQKRCIKFIQKISPDESRNINKNDNLYWFSSKLKDVFSTNLSLRYSLYNSDYNKRQIDKLYKEAKIQNIIDIFEKTIREMYEIYVNNIKLDGFETLEDNLKNLQNKMEKEGEEENIEEYLKKYKHIAQNLEQIFKEKIGRKRRHLENNI